MQKINKLDIKTLSILFFLIFPTIVCCTNQDNDTAVYLVEDIDIQSFAKHNILTLKSDAGDLYVVVTEKLDSLSVLTDGRDWIQVDIGLSVTLTLIEQVLLPPVEYVGPVRGDLMLYYPQENLEDIDTSIGYESEGYWKGRISFFEYGEIQCKVHRSDDIVGMYVRKSAVVQDE